MPEAGKPLPSQRLEGLMQEINAVRALLRRRNALP
jgi:hypothetical protein